MSKISLQFHANRDEIALWIVGWTREFGLTIATESFTPAYGARACSGDELAVRLSTSSDIQRVAVNLAPIDLSATSSFDFLRSNPDVLTVFLGAQSHDELRESALNAMTDDERSITVWRAIRSQAKASMLSGSRVVNPMTGAEQQAKGHFYSPGALKSARHGVRLLASAGWNEYRLDN